MKCMILRGTPSHMKTRCLINCLLIRLKCDPKNSLKQRKDLNEQIQYFILYMRRTCAPKFEKCTPPPMIGNFFVV